MFGQRALAWAAALALAATVSMAPQPARFSAPVTSALAQDDSAADAGEPAQLAIAALHCAEAPAAEALTSFFATGAAPSGCSPAVGVTISVSENGAPVPSSPFTTDVAGTVVLPVSLGSAVEVSEEPASLPSGYEPLTQEANGVPYANPVQIDAAVAGAAVLFVNVPRSVATELAQDAPADEAGEAIDLAVVALQCAAAPAAETLTSFFSNGTPPSGCAPAVGVSVAVTENERPLSGSPFTIDADGGLAVPVGLGAMVSVTEDPTSLPTGYEPLTHTANGVPYANPVELDSATADAAVLFVNVPASAAAKLASDALAVGGGATNLAHAVTRDRTGCDPAYPDERTCIAPGRPLAAPCSITDQRNFTVLAPDPRGLDADHDGIGCEPIPPSGGTIARDANVNLSSSGGNVRRAAPSGARGVAVAARGVRSDAGVRVSAPGNSRANAMVVHRDRGSAGLWFVAPARTSTGNVAIASNPIFIANGLWGWPNGFSRDDWIWRGRTHDWDGVRFQPSAIDVGNVTVVGSGSGNVAIASNPIFISHGVWAWPDRNHDDDWPWRDRLGAGVRGWPSRIAIGNLAVARSGNGSVAAVSNPVLIGNGLWSWPNHDWFRSNVVGVGNISVAGSDTGAVAITSNSTFIGQGVRTWPIWTGNDDWRWRNRAGNHDWNGHSRIGNHMRGWPSIISVGNLTIASSGSGNGASAIASNPIVIIASGLWLVPSDRNHNHDWGDYGDRGHITRDHADAERMESESAQTDRSDVEGQAIDGGASEAPPGEIELLAASEQSPLTVNGGLAVEPAPADSIQTPSDGDVALPSEGAIEPPSDGAVAAPPNAADQPPADARASDASFVAIDPSDVDSGSVAAVDVDAGYVAPDSGGDPGYVAPDPAVDSGSVDPSYVDPSSVAPEPVYVAPSYVEPTYVAPEPVYVEPSYVDAGYVAPDPAIEPSYSAPQSSSVDPGVDVTYEAPEPSYVAPEPSYVDTGNGAANPGMDAGFGGQNASNIAPEPHFADPGMDAGYVDGGTAGAGNVAPDLGMDDAGNVDPGSVAPDSGGGSG